MEWSQSSVLVDKCHYKIIVNSSILPSLPKTSRFSLLAQWSSKQGLTQDVVLKPMSIHAGPDFFLGMFVIHFLLYRMESLTCND